MNSTRKMIREFLEWLPENSIYAITVSDEKNGHAFGIRRLPGRKIIEFFDSNIGLMSFSDQGIFIDFFQMLLSIYALNSGRGFTKVDLIKLCWQASANTLVIKNNNNNDSENAFMARHTTISDYAHLFHMIQEKFQNGFYSNMSLSILKRYFIDNMDIPIKYTNDVSVLYQLQALLALPTREFSKEPYHDFKFVTVLRNKQHPIFDFISHVSYPSETTSITRLRAAIKVRIAQLIRAKDNTSSPHNPITG
jgi:hypothetical protein